MSPACQVREWIYLYWGRPPTQEEQQFCVAFMAEKGDDLTLASIYDSPNALPLREKRGW